MKKYKFETPFDWLEWHIHQDGVKDVATLQWIISKMGRVLDSDEIQDLFQDIMEDDGYFIEIEV